MAHFSNKEIHVLIFASPKLAFAGPGLSARALNVAPSILIRGSHTQKRRQWDQGHLELMQPQVQQCRQPRGAGRDQEGGSPPGELQLTP